MPKNYKGSAVLQLDKYNLDEEVEIQSEAYGYWARKLAKAKKRVGAAKAELSLTKAELRLAIRQRPSVFGFSGKPTNDAVEDKAVTQPPYQLASAELIDAQYEQDQLDAIVSGLEQKKSMIEQACFLDGRSYFARPKQAINRPRGFKKRGPANARHN